MKDFKFEVNQKVYIGTVANGNIGRVVVIDKEVVGGPLGGHAYLVEIPGNINVGDTFKYWNDIFGFDKGYKFSVVTPPDCNLNCKWYHEDELTAVEGMYGVKGMKCEQHLPVEPKAPITKIDLHKNICNGLNNIYISKNSDYGDSFGETYKNLGIISAVTRITDKVNRLQSLCVQEQKVSDESMMDTLRDLANYAIMTIIELEGGNNE